ncbi:MAG: FAD-dependent oxidoreductase [Erysipelotrichaceae bacterium]|nr:FAD-dependent oxidoreductase [Erysipelotrichaceae bacterium]
MRKHELVIIGAGAAGLSCALASYHAGIKDILILEKEEDAGGILNQCIHTGFGLHTFKEELSGPAYAQRCIDLLSKTSVQIQCSTMVLSVTKEKQLVCSSSQYGLETIQAKAIVFATGCRERSRGAIQIPGSRPAGVLTAGAAQRYLNLDGWMCGKKVIILGSGDIGLIMARRMTLEGAKVVAVAELMPYSNGLPRNIKQCLDDFDIPLYLSHTIVKIEGKDRVSGVVLSQVDEHLQPISGSEKHFDVDTVLLSVGLIPENTLLEQAGAQLHPKTRGPVVDERCMTSLDGIFACGNSLHVHDLVDFVFAEGQRAGYAAAEYLKKTYMDCNVIMVRPEGNISYVLPQKLHTSDTKLLYRVKTPMKNAELILMSKDKVLKRVRKVSLIPSIMEEIAVTKELLQDCDEELIVEVKPWKN